MDTLGKRIRQARKRKGLSQSDLGRLCNGLSRSAVAQWEAGLTEPTVSEVLGVSGHWLVHGGPMDGPQTAASADSGPVNEELLKLAIAAGLSFLELNRLQVPADRASALFLEIYHDAKENLADGTQENPVTAVTASAKAVLRTLKS